MFALCSYLHMYACIKTMYSTDLRLIQVTTLRTHCLHGSTRHTHAYIHKDESTNAHNCKHAMCGVYHAVKVQTYNIHTMFVSSLVCGRIFTFVARLRMPSCQFACLLASTVCIHFAFVFVVLYTLTHIHAHTDTHTNTSQLSGKKEGRGKRVSERD